MILKIQRNVLPTWTKKNLYGYAMSKPFPSGVFKWLDPAKFNLNKYGDDS